jgi:hypothetical protein
MKPKLDGIIAVTLVVCAVITTGMVLRREFTAPAGAPSVDEKKPI